MKKLWSFFVLFGILTCGQNSKSYDYTKYQDRDLLKIKTEVFLRNLKSAGFIITKNEVTGYTIDIKIKMNNTEFDTMFIFGESVYSVSYSNPVSNYRGKKVYLSRQDEKQAKMIDLIEDLLFKFYINEVNSNF